MQYESTCDATVGRPCGECVVVARNRLNALAHNLAVAGGLCRAYDIGMERMRMIWCRDEIDPVRDWHPGCGRTAPGWTREEGR